MRYFYVKTLILIILFVICYLTFVISPVTAVVDPLAVPNNRVGVHILDTGEVFQASQLVNSHGGDWGYVTIPMRIDDRDREKWLRFFTSCRQNHLIPVIRLATYVDGQIWTTPTVYDLIDFANFLNDMPWPVKNRYIIIFNEPNHAKEWGGSVSPAAYALILKEARKIFKSRSDDFYILNAGLDMSAPTSKTSMDALLFYRKMTFQSPDWYDALDGISVHAYPNPGFSASPWSAGRFGITSYRYELKLFKSFSFSPKPVFITETGFIGGGDFFHSAFSSIWQEVNIAAITPFVLFAGAGDFVPFSLTDQSHHPKNSYMEIFNLTKTGGSPLLNPAEKGMKNNDSYASGNTSYSQNTSFIQRLKNLFLPPLPRLTVGNTVITVEKSDTPAAREKGLSYRKSLPADSGMLFTFPGSQIQTFWMKDMNFPLDFIWINNYRIVNLTENVRPPTQTGGSPSIISSAFPVDWVLEVNAGFIKTHLIQIGDTVVLNSP